MVIHANRNQLRDVIAGHLYNVHFGFLHTIEFVFF